MDWPGGGLAEWLRQRTDGELITLLGRRPDAAAARSFEDLADRLSTPWSVRNALDLADKAMLQLVEVLQALGDGVPVERLEHLLGRRPGPPLERLVELGLVWQEDDRLRLTAPLAELTESPLGLGAPVGELLPALTVEQLKTIAAGYGDRTQRRKADLIDLLAGVLTDQERVRKVLAELPPPLAELAARLAWEGPYVHGSLVTTALRGKAADNGPGALIRLGWVLPVGWDAGQMPLEVALAVRGPDYRPQLDSGPPFVAASPVHGAHLTAGSRSAALSTVDGARRLVEHMGRSPLATVQAGGVGSRELSKAAKAIGAAEPELRLWLETLAGAGLVAVHSGRAMPTAAADAWLAAEPADALVTLLRAWWTLDRLPVHFRDDSGKALPALGWGTPVAVPLRHDLLRTLDELGHERGFCDLDAVTEHLVWLRPGLLGDAARARPLVAAALTEGELLGAFAVQALTPLGRALRGGAAGAVGAGELHASAAALLPAPATSATFLPDLTALVSGAPAAGLAGLLDSAADAESRDAASTWRFTPASVRRAFDAGRTADQLLTELSAAADRPLPQPLTYLVRDVARRHGRLRVTAVGCCVVADDPALAAEIANHRQLAGLGLRLLADTVLASTEPATTVLPALRAAGYAPVMQDAGGATLVERQRPRRAPARTAPPAVEQPDPADVVQRLRSAPQRPASAGYSSVHDDVAIHASRLTPAEQRLLADAIEDLEPILIEYTSTGGTRSTRVIEPQFLMPPLLVAWCQLRDAERHFLLGSITAVAPTP